MLTEYQKRARRHTIAASAVNTFGLDLFRHLVKAPGNQMFSPLSVYELLGLAFAGAAGRTAEQMSAVLRWGLDQRDTPPASILDMKDDAARLVIAAAGWAQRGCKFLTGYTDRVAGPYRGGFFDIDFAADPETARQRINAWIGQKTSGKIPDLISPGTANVLTRFILTSALYLDAAWASRFDGANTAIRPFHLANGGRTEVPMMHQTALLPAVEEDRFLAVHLPYRGERFSMQVYLPRDPADLAWLEERFIGTGPDHWQREMSLHDVTLSLPRFRLTGSVLLGRVLREMGMPDAFGPSADFSAMRPPDDTLAEGGFYLSEIVHKTFVEVDEAGTRAAAASGMILTGGVDSKSPPPLVVTIDHPFLFTITAHTPIYRAPTLVFLGRVMDPTA